MKKTLMITGASGFIGTNFIEKYKVDFNIIPVCLIENKPEDLDYTGVDCILHLAALVHQINRAPEEKYFEVNTELTKRLANKAKESGVGHFVFYSTVAVYGTHGSIDEEIVLNVSSPTNPKDAYGRSKLQAEDILRDLEDEDFIVSVIRPPMVYGDNCPGNMTKLEKLVKAFPVLPFGNDEFKRSLVHVDKLLEETKTIIDSRKKGIFVLKDEKDVSIRGIVESLAVKNHRRIFLIKMPRFLLKVLYKIKPRIVNSLYGSLRFKKEKELPLISIVTVSFNSEKTIRDTIESVLNQSYTNIEYIIVDGKSTDRTMVFVKQYKEKFDEKGICYKYISEKDNGIYDAMNKGIAMASGELIGLINSDDFYEISAVETVVRVYLGKYFDISLGNMRVINGKESFIKKARNSFYFTTRGWTHPTMFVKKELYIREKYLCKNIYDDLDFILRVKKLNYRICIIDEIISNFRFGGVSTNKKFWDILKDIKIRNQIYKVNGYSRIHGLDNFVIELIKFFYSRIK